MDVRLEERAVFKASAVEGWTVLAYVYNGAVSLNSRRVAAEEIALFDRTDGDVVASLEGPSYF